MSILLSDYGFIRVGSASPQHRVGDSEFNKNNIIMAIKHLYNEKCSIAVLPELCITGYTCGDLFYQEKLLERTRQIIAEIAEETELIDIVSVIGCPVDCEGKLYNCAIVIQSGEIKGIVPKTYLPNTDEFYEERWFSSEFDRLSDTVLYNGREILFGADLLFEFDSIKDCRFGIEICEDLWSVSPPSESMAKAGAVLLINLSASNELLGKEKYRLDLVRTQSARCIAAYIYSSAGPGESSTDLLFSGDAIIAENGVILSRGDRFQYGNQYNFTDIDISGLLTERKKNNSFGISKPSCSYKVIKLTQTQQRAKNLIRSIPSMPFVPSDISRRAENCREIFKIQYTALNRRIRHLSAGNVVIGLSGGLDSTLALLVAVKAFSNLNINVSGIHAITMPGFGTSSETKSNAIKLAKLLGVSLREIPINKAVNLHFKDIGHDSSIHDVVYENAQARERTQILMDISNQVNGIVIGTGDLSELALGWCTYNGDHISMYGVNAGVPKTLVRYIIEWCAEEEFSGEISSVLKSICATPISPELLPADADGKIQQKTESIIGPYLLHDFFLYYFVRKHYSPKKILMLAEYAFGENSKNFYSREEIIKWMKVFYTRFFSQQFKRSCMPDGIKVGSVSLSPRGDWRMPSDAVPSMWLEEIDKL
ncbi:MAG: hypothetical protein QG635_2485 [Bacteroidota bacterium]|nr:hypothetical protein [Bacteroidota bacterium]